MTAPRRGDGDPWEESPAENTTSPRRASQASAAAEVVLATDGQLVQAYDPVLRSLSLRDLLELLVASDTRMLWELKAQRMSEEWLEATFANEGIPEAFPGEGHMSDVRDLLRHIAVGEFRAITETVQTCGLASVVGR